MEGGPPFSLFYSFNAVAPPSFPLLSHNHNQRLATDSSGRMLPKRKEGMEFVKLRKLLSKKQYAAFQTF